MGSPDFEVSLKELLNLTRKISPLWECFWDDERSVWSLAKHTKTGTHGLLTVEGVEYLVSKGRCGPTSCITSSLSSIAQLKAKWSQRVKFTESKEVKA